MKAIKPATSLKRKRTFATAITHIALVTLSLMFSLPLIWMLSTALKPLDQTMSSHPTWIPHPAQWGNFWDAFSYDHKELGYLPFLVYGRNTIIITVLCMIGAVFSNSLVAYSFARIKWPGREFFFGITLASMMVPFPVLMVPLYGVFRHLHWIGTLLPLWVPAFFGSAFNIFLMRQFFRTIPEELSEAARIDGCSEWRIFWRIVLPLSKPVLATAALLHFLYAWNDFMAPLLYLTRKSTYTLSLALQSYESQTGGVQWHYLMAASAVTVLPVVVLFFFTQKVFIQGIATTGTKG